MNKEKIIKTIKEYTILILVAFFFASSIIQGSLVPTGSMERTIRVGDFIFVNRLAYDFYTPRNIPHTSVKLPFFQIELFDGPERGDIVVFEFPGYQNEIEPEELQSWVKRCVGLPGDTVFIRDRVLYVNSEEFPRPEKINYVYPHSKAQGMIGQGEQIFPKNSGWNDCNYGPLVVPKEGEVVKLTPSNIYKYEPIINREYGKKAVSILKGKIYIDDKPADTYTVKQDYYFMVGDNRDDSADSRVWGFVPRDKILGEPLFVFWSWDSNIPFSQFFKLLGSARLDRIGKIL